MEISNHWRNRRFNSVQLEHVHEHERTCQTTRHGRQRPRLAVSALSLPLNPPPLPPAPLSATRQRGAAAPLAWILPQKSPDPTKNSDSHRERPRRFASSAPQCGAEAKAQSLLHSRSKVVSAILWAVRARLTLWTVFIVDVTLALHSTEQTALCNALHTLNCQNTLPRPQASAVPDANNEHECFRLPVYYGGHISRVIPGRSLRGVSQYLQNNLSEVSVGQSIGSH